MKLAAADVQTVVIPGAGHWVAEEAPEELLTALTEFLAPCRDGEAAAHETHERGGMPPEATSSASPQPQGRGRLDPAPPRERGHHEHRRRDR